MTPLASIRCPARVRWVLVKIALLWLLTLGQSAQAAQTAQKLEAEADRMATELERAVAELQPVVERYGYAGVAAAVSVEGFGVPAPGQTMLMAAALEAARGHLHIVVLCVVAVLAAVAGNSLGYLIGRIGGRPLLRRLRVNEAREQRIAGLFDRYGGGFIVLARFLDGLRQLNGIVAGVFGMRWWVFTAFNALGAVLWVGLWGLGAYYVSEHMHAVDGFIRQINPWLSGVVVIGVIALAIYLFRGRTASARSRARDASTPVRRDRP
jgi:membrane protein DedA with SNARE-associated domain